VLHDLVINRPSRRAVVRAPVPTFIGSSVEQFSRARAEWVVVPAVKF
jgi:hypothetical protein